MEMTYCRMAGKEAELNKLGGQWKINVRGSSNIEHICEVIFIKCLG